MPRIVEFPTRCVFDAMGSIQTRLTHRLWSIKLIKHVNRKYLVGFDYPFQLYNSVYQQNFISLFITLQHKALKQDQTMRTALSK